MTDFLGRIAARAVGAPALARPRLPTLPAGTRDGGLEVVDEEVVVPGTAPASPEAGLAPASPADTPAAVAPAVAPTGRAVELLPPERPPPAPEPALALPAEARAAAPPAEPRAPVATVAVRATPAAPVLAAPVARAATATAATSSDELPPVRVHIGRLEVRANLHEAPRSQPPPEAREPDGLSLSDYLRGRRGA